MVTYVNYKLFKRNGPSVKCYRKNVKLKYHQKHAEDNDNMLIKFKTYL